MNLQAAIRKCTKVRSKAQEASTAEYARRREVILSGEYAFLRATDTIGGYALTCPDPLHLLPTLFK